MNKEYKRIKQYRINKCRGELTKTGFEKSSKILEIGSGAGEEVLWWATSGSNCTAVEISGENCKIIMKKLKQENMRTHVDVVEADGEHLPFRDSLFDMVFCKAVLHHIRKPLRAVCEMRRVARDGGIVAAIDESNALNPFWHISKSKRLRKFFPVLFSTYSWEWEIANYATSFYPWQMHYFFKKADLKQIKAKSLWLPYTLELKQFFKLYLLLERMIEKTPIPYVLGQLFVVGRK